MNRYGTSPILVIDQSCLRYKCLTLSLSIKLAIYLIRLVSLDTMAGLKSIYIQVLLYSTKRRYTTMVHGADVYLLLFLQLSCDYAKYILFASSADY